MISIRKWFYKPKRNDTSMLAQFFHADEELNQIAAELDSFDGRKDPERCTMLVNQLRQCQDKVLNTVNSMMAEAIPTHRANRDFRVKFPDDVLQDNLFGQLWFGAECLAAGSSIMNREAESSSMRPLAKAVTRSLEHLRHLLRDQALRNCGLYSERIKECLRRFDKIFAEFELSYVSAMVPVKTMKEYDIMQEVIVLFSETVQRALTLNLLTQEQTDDYDPALMFTIPRLAIVCGLIVYPEGPLNVDQFAEDMCEMFRPFQSLLYKIRELLWTLSTSELYQLERALCSSEQPIVAATTTADSPTLVRAYARADATDFIQRFYLDHPECEEFVDVLYGTRCCGGGGGSGSTHASPSDATVVADDDDDDDDDDDRDCCCVEDDEDEEDDGVETTIADSDSQEDFIAAQNFIAMQESFSEILENVIEGKVAAAGDVDDDDDESNCGARSPRSSSGGGGAGEVRGVVGGSLPKDSGLHSESEEEAERCGGEGETPRGGSARRESATAVNCDRHAEEEEGEQETPVTIASDRARGGGGGGGGGARSGCDSRNGASHEEGIGASTETTAEDSPEARLDASEPRLDPAVRAAVEGTFGDLISEETVDIVYGLFLGDAPCKRSPRARRRGNDDDDNAPHGGAADANPKSESSKIREFFPAAAAAAARLADDAPRICVVASTPSPDGGPPAATRAARRAGRAAARARQANGIHDGFTLDAPCSRGGGGGGGGARSDELGGATDDGAGSDSPRKTAPAPDGGAAAEHAAANPAISPSATRSRRDASCSPESGKLPRQPPNDASEHGGQQRCEPPGGDRNCVEESCGGARGAGRTRRERACDRHPASSKNSPVAATSDRTQASHASGRAPPQPAAAAEDGETGSCIGVPASVRRGFATGAAITNSPCSSCNSEGNAPRDWDTDSYGSGDTSSYNSECNDDEEIALAMQAAEISMRNAVRAKFHSSEDLIHRLFVCICGVADQLQTNYASDLRNILKWVFEINSTHPLVGAGDGYRGDDDEDAEDAADEEAVVAALLQSRLRVSRGTQSEAILSSPSQPSPSRQRSTIEEPPPWVPDDQSSCCVSCKAMFTVVRRRHHCRNCGKIFCARCSCNSVPLPKYGHTKPVRVCNRCYMYQVTPFTVD